MAPLTDRRTWRLWLRRTLEAGRASLIGLTTENLGLKTMSLGLSVVIWALLQSEQVVERRTRVKVRYDWPEDLVRVDEVPRYVSITVSGPQGRVRSIDQRTLTMRVDLSEAERGTVPIDFTDRTVHGLPDNLKVTQTTPPMTEVQLDAKIRRTVRVRPAVIGEPAEGWSTEAITVEPESVEIEGPESILKDLTEVSTDIVNISGTRAPVTSQVAIKPPTRTLTPTDATPVSVRVAVEALMDDRTFSDVPVITRTPNWVSEPTTVRFVTLTGPAQEVAALKDERISILVNIPDAENRTAREVRWMRNDPDQSVSVIHYGSPDTIRVIEMSPDRFSVRPTEPLPTP